MIPVTRHALRAEIRRLRRELEVVSSTHEAMKHLVRCTDPAMHIRLAHQLQQAETMVEQSAAYVAAASEIAQNGCAIDQALVRRTLADAAVDPHAASAGEGQS